MSKSLYEHANNLESPSDVKNTLEGLIDKHSLGFVLEMCADLCAEKADHVSTNWQDGSLCKEWMRCFTRIQSLVFGRYSVKV